MVAAFFDFVCSQQYVTGPAAASTCKALWAINIRAQQPEHNLTDTNTHMQTPAAAADVDADILGKHKQLIIDSDSDVDGGPLGRHSSSSDCGSDSVRRFVESPVLTSRIPIVGQSSSNRAQNLLLLVAWRAL